MTRTASIDKTRPHKLAMPTGEDAAQSPVLIYQYLDDGECVEVPNTPANQTPGVLAQEMRILQTQFLQRAEEALIAKGVPDWQRQFEHDDAKRRAQEMADRAKVYDELEQMMCCGYHSSGLPLPDHQHHARTRAALAEYLETKPERDAMRDAISDPASCRAWEIVEQQAEVSLQYAYFFDTSDIHDREQCRRISAVEIFQRMNAG
ncbi:MAG: hypothetical protein HY019_08635 [Aquabacterium sp.]|uniref:hypothetical protein n=1 Tax=Aquabacterium sp. TaxID=1872578 RepID=UPI0025BBD486|nr:hypothetical protein [Aquabacterium sp.]MBI3382057.1 hypothetical protein [Aquabacterium sp.]